MPDERAGNAGAAVQLRLERQDDHHVVHATLDPPHAARPPSPELRRDVIDHATPGLLGHTGEVEIEPGIVDQDDEVERFLSENLSDGKNPTGQGADRGRPDDPDHVQVAEALHQLHAGSLHAWAAY